MRDHRAGDEHARQASASSRKAGQRPRQQQRRRQQPRRPEQRKCDAVATQVQWLAALAPAAHRRARTPVAPASRRAAAMRRRSRRAAPARSPRPRLRSIRARADASGIGAPIECIGSSTVGGNCTWKPRAARFSRTTAGFSRASLRSGPMSTSSTNASVPSLRAQRLRQSCEIVARGEIDVGVGLFQAFVDESVHAGRAMVTATAYLPACRPANRAQRGFQRDFASDGPNPRDLAAEHATRRSMSPMPPGGDSRSSHRTTGRSRCNASNRATWRQRAIGHDFSAMAGACRLVPFAHFDAGDFRCDVRPCVVLAILTAAVSSATALAAPPPTAAMRPRRSRSNR